MSNEQTVFLKHFFVMKAMRIMPDGNMCIAERAVNFRPSNQLVTQFLLDFPEADFCTLDENYKILPKE